MLFTQTFFEEVIVNGNRTHISIEVIDKGIGIPKSEQKYMFTPFHRYTNVANVEGTGLGMAIIKRCVDLLNGSISVESLTEYSEMVLRSKDEVLQLFKDKGNEFVKSKLRQI